MRKIILAVISGITILVGIVLINNQNAINHINQDLDSNPSAAGVGLSNGGDPARNNASGLGSGSKHSAGKGLIRVLKTVENGVTSYSDAPARQTIPQAKAQATTATTSTNTKDTTVLKTVENGVTSYSDVPARQTVTQVKDQANTANIIDTTDSNTPKTEIIEIKKGVGSVSQSTSTSSQTCKVKNMGVNIEGISYYSQGMPFIDLAKMSWGWHRSWGSSWEGVKLDLDSNGYLKTVDAGKAQTIISDDLWGRNKDDKRYVLLYDGEGQLEFNLIKPKIIKSEPGRIELELGEGRLGMAQLSTNPSNYLRNIRLIPIEYENDYKQSIVQEQFKKMWQEMGVIRYLNTQAINNSTEIEWKDRPKPNKFGAKGGQSIEDIIQMSNEMNVNPWLLVPHMANDDYFRKMAIYVKDNLKSNLKVYIEYTNEAWNWQFSQTKYLAALAKKKGTTPYQEYGKRAKKLFDIWLNVFGSEDRIVRVIGTQFGNPWISEQIMKTPGLKGSVDALAVGYYIGHELGSKKMASKTLTMSNGEIFSYLHNVSLPKAKKLLQEQKIVADNYGLDLVAYEAGQHLVASGVSAELGVLVDNQALTEKLISINRDSRMADFYMDMYSQWNEVGGGLIVWFATTDKPTKWGSWGLLESMGQDPEKAPKYQAVQRMLADQGC